MNQPKLDLTVFFLSISSAAYIGLGLASHDGQEKKVNLPLARQNIELLELMQEKTKGNLSADETKLLQQLLFELRMRYLEVEKTS